VYGLKTVVFRHSSIFGGRQYASFDQGWVGWFCQKAIEQKLAYKAGMAPEPFTIAGTGKQVRDVLYAEDLIHLYRSAYEQREHMNGEIFNIGGGFSNSLSLLELFALLSELLDIPPLVFTSTPRRASDQDCFIASIKKAQRLLGWEPSVTSREGVIRMLNWTEKHLLETP
jgi:CDP-paratose 2-epimerase